jgi:ADP-ribose pyrophosphatase
MSSETTTGQASAANPQEHSITTLSSRDVYVNPWMRVREDQVRRSNGHTGIYGVVEKDDAAIILPIEPEFDGGKGRIWLVEQFRYSVQQRCIELPQGGWEMDTVAPEELARGELKEELGLEAASMIQLGTLWISYGYAKQRQHVFLATGLTHTDKDPDPEEHDLIVHTATIADFEQMMLDGTIRDNCTLSAWALYLMWKARQ